MAAFFLFMKNYSLQNGLTNNLNSDTLWYYTNHNGLAHYWALEDPNPYDPNHIESPSNLLIELDSKMRDLIDNNNLLTNKINDILLMLSDRDNMTPISAEELLDIIGGDANG